MQLKISHRIDEELILPLNYQHILQSIIYKKLSDVPEYSDFVHNEGYSFWDRHYRMFVFDFLKGKYEIENGKIRFRDKLSFEVRSPEVGLIRLLKNSIDNYGLDYIGHKISEVETKLCDETIVSEGIRIKMRTPISVYSTDKDTGKSYYYTPQEQEFYQLVNENFLRKYFAYTGVVPSSGIILNPVNIVQKDKFVTNYKGYYISGWKGTYELYGEPKYLDFLYQTGLGSRNSQGFGLFDVE